MTPEESPQMKTAARHLLIAMLALVFSAPAWAGPPTDQARQYTDQVRKVLEDQKLPPADRRAAVRKIAIEIFDVGETAKRALGRHWQGRTPMEREEFTDLFADLLESTYISRIDQYGGERLTYVSEAIDGEFAVVRAKIVRPQGAEVPVEARMLRRGDRWLIYDIAIEGISLISNYRSQFDRIIRTSSYEELVKRLRTKRDEFLNEKAAKPRPTS
jgi:phospholipid transport system substrate-binding protein